MKKLILCAMIVAISANAFAQTDSLVINNPDQVIITKSSTEQSVTVKGLPDDPGYSYYRKVSLNGEESIFESEYMKGIDFSFPFIEKDRNSKNGIGLMNLYWGFMINNVSPTDYRFSSWASHDYGLTIYDYNCRFANGLGAFSIGLGLGVKDFVSTSGVMYGKNTLGGIDVLPVPSDIRLKKSIVRVNEVFIPFMLTLQSPNDKFAFSFGPIVNLNYKCKVKNKYYVDNEKIKVKMKGVDVNTVTADIMAGLKFDDFGIFVKYSPFDLFENAHAPAATTWTVGIQLY